MAWGLSVARPRMRRPGVVKLLEVSPDSSHRPVIMIYPAGMSLAQVNRRKAARAAPDEYMAFDKVPNNCIRVLAHIDLRGSTAKWTWLDDPAEQNEPQIISTHDLTTGREESHATTALVPRWRSRDQTFTGERVIAWLFALSLLCAVFSILHFTFAE